MYHSHAKSDKVNRLHERYLRVIYTNKMSTFKQLLEKDNSVSIHTRNLRFLAEEIFKVVKGLEPNILVIYFPSKNKTIIIAYDENPF